MDPIHNSTIHLGRHRKLRLEEGIQVRREFRRNSRVQVFDSIGNWTAEWRGPEEDPFVRPTGLAYDPAGRLWVADPGTARVRALTLAGTELFGFGGPGDGVGHFRAPVDVAVDSEGIVVSSSETGTVTVQEAIRAAHSGVNQARFDMG